MPPRKTSDQADAAITDVAGVTRTDQAVTGQDTDIVGTSTAAGTAGDLPGPDTGTLQEQITGGPGALKTDPVVFVEDVRAVTNRGPTVIDPANVAGIPVEVAGPGAGALQVARPTQGFETRPLDGEGRDPRDRTALERLGDRPLVLGAGSRRLVSDVLIDADKVAGRRTVRAATQIMRDGGVVLPGEELSVDFAEYTALVQIGAIVATPWGGLDRDE